MSARLRFSTRDSESVAIPLPNQVEQQTFGRPKRERKILVRLSVYYLSVTEAHADYLYNTSVIPTTYDEAITSEDAAQWKAAMDTEMAILQATDICFIKPLPPNRDGTKGRLVYNVKQGKRQGLTQLIADTLLMVTHRYLVSPTTRRTSIRALL